MFPFPLPPKTDWVRRWVGIGPNNCGETGNGSAHSLGHFCGGSDHAMRGQLVRTTSQPDAVDQHCARQFGNRKAPLFILCC